MLLCWARGPGPGQTLSHLQPRLVTAYLSGRTGCTPGYRSLVWLNRVHAWLPLTCVAEPGARLVTAHLCG